MVKNLGSSACIYLVRAPIGVPGWGEARVKGRVDPRGVEGRVEAGGVESLCLYHRLRGGGGGACPGPGAGAGGGGVAGGHSGGGGGVV